MKKTLNSYKKSGVNIPLANKLVKYISKLSKKMSKKGIIHFVKKQLADLGLCLTLVILR